MAFEQIVSMYIAAAWEATMRVIGIMVEALVGLFCFLWRLFTLAHLAVIEWLDGLFPEFGIADSKLLRALVAGVVGAIWSTFLVLVVAGIKGLWGLVAMFVAGVGLSMAAGLAAGPGKD